MDLRDYPYAKRLIEGHHMKHINKQGEPYCIPYAIPRGVVVGEPIAVPRLDTLEKRVQAIVERVTHAHPKDGVAWQRTLISMLTDLVKAEGRYLRNHKQTEDENA